MKVLLSGFNIDRDGLGNKELTPETISAAYARISRSEKDIPSLREEARCDVAKSRKSNESIVFGLGHSSIAEHAVFNFDLMGVSRAAIEHIQRHRLASYTEKSQRYVSFDTGYHIPEEIEDDKKALTKYKSFCDRCFDEYSKAQKILLENDFSRTESNEDARYFLPLSAYTQCGMTINGRSLEYLISDLRSQDSYELNSIGNKLADQISGVAPSIIKYTEKREIFKKIFMNVNYAFPKENVGSLTFSKNHEKELCGILNFSRKGKKFKIPAALSDEDRDFIERLLIDLNEYDRIPREFELPEAMFIAYCSASCFAQLKRHRMSTVITQAYSLKESPYIPDSFLKTNLPEVLHLLSKLSLKTDIELRKKNPQILQYSALNASKRAVFVKMNSRELYHFIRLRSDIHAQLEIRRIADLIASRARKEYPSVYRYLFGKDEFKKIKESLSRSN
ncbi:MAG: FAD-dependent thymidylate synthase [bacterium]|nr:FAD-dependent thymidylate synthase [bacterium]